MIDLSNKQLVLVEAKVKRGTYKKREVEKYIKEKKIECYEWEEMKESREDGKSQSSGISTDSSNR